MVEIHVDKRETTIDNATGDVEKTVRGTVKGFGTGFRSHLERGGQTLSVEASLTVGQYPAGHPRAGKWAVQIMLDGFVTQEEAETLGARAEENVRRMLEASNVFQPMPESMTQLLKKD